MISDTRPPKNQDNVVSSLNMAIDVLNLAKEVSSITPAKAVFGSVSALLVMIKDSMINEADYIALGLTCADICAALERGMDGKRLSDLNQPVREAIERLRRTVEEIKLEIKSKTGNPSKLRAILRVFHAKNDKETIAAWRSDLNIVLEVFNIQLAITTHITVSDIHREVSDIRRDVSQIRERNEDQCFSAQTGPGESPPPPPPRVLFGRDGLIKEIVRLVDGLTPIALIGTGGIGKTSVALTALHHVQVKERFGDNRRFIRCDQFPGTRTHFLRRLSKVIGAGVENPEDLASLRPFLSSKEMLIVLDNAESILDPQGTNNQGVYAVVEELSQFDNICLCITSRISIIPPDCEVLDIPTLSVDAARDAFYGIYKNGKRADMVDGVLEQLNFHPLSITLLATVAHHNKWDANRLTKEWEIRRTDVLRTDHNKSLAAAIELSLTSPMFRELGRDARALLEVVAFFPQGVDENNLDWLFPTIINRRYIFDKFCVLSLTYRSGTFATMLAPLRDYLRPKDPKPHPLLQITKEHYINRLTVDVDPDIPAFEGGRWIMLEDVNIEHLLDVFISLDNDSGDVCNACANFVGYLFRYKPRLVILGPKIEGLPDDHPSKPRCLVKLSRLLGSVGCYGEEKRLLTHTLKLQREKGDDLQVAQTLMGLASSNRMLGLHKEGILQAKEASEIYERLNDTVGQADTLQRLALYFAEDDQFDAAEEAVFHAIDLSDRPTPSRICEHYYVLGHIYHSRGETEATISHLEVALGITIFLNVPHRQSSILLSLVWLYFEEARFDDAQVHLEQLKSCVANDPYTLGQVMLAQGYVWRQQGRLEEAKSEVSRIIGAYETTGFSAHLLERYKTLLRDIEEEMDNLVTPDESDDEGPAVPGGPFRTSCALRANRYVSP